MSIRALREGVRAWLESMTRIDVWDLDIPRNLPTVIDGIRYPANSCVELPVKDLGIDRNENFVEADGKFTYGLLYRFSGKAAKHQLPVSSVEALLMFLAEYAIANPQALYENILDIRMDGTANPVGINRVEGEDQDWLVIARLELRIRFVVSAADFDDLGFGVLQPPSLTQPGEVITINEIRTGLYRATAPVKPNDPSTFIKDQELRVGIEWEGFGETPLADGDTILVED